MPDHNDELLLQLYSVEGQTERNTATQKVSSLDDQVMSLYGVQAAPAENPAGDFIAGVATLPGEIANTASQALTGSRITAPPVPRDSPSYRAGQAFTNAVIGGTTAGILGGRVSPGARGYQYGTPLERVEGNIRQFARDVGTTFRRAPARVSLAEGSLGAIASYGGSYAEQAFPDTEGARVIGELLAGTTPMAAVGLGRGAFRITGKIPGISWAVTQANRHYQNITFSGARRRVSNRLDRATVDREADLLSMSEELVPGAKEIMTPAMRTNSEGLMALERSVYKAIDGGKVSEEFLTNYRAINDLIIADIRQSGRAPDLDVGANRLQLELSKIGLFVDERIRQAALDADSAIEGTLTQLDNEGLSRIVRGHLESALKEAREMETAFWGLVPDKVRVPTEGSSQAYISLRDSMGRPQRENIPAAARRWLDPKSKDYQTFIEGEAEIKDLRGLYSQLRAEARAARSGDAPNFDKARIADSLADAVLADMNMAMNDPSMDGYSPLQQAINYSRMLNQKFGTGAPGQILRMGRDSGDVIPANLTLNNTIGGGGPRAGEAIDRILDATENNPDTANAVQNYLRNLFLKSVRYGEGEAINANTGRTFIRNNDAALRRFPELRQEFQSAIDARDAAVVAERVLPKAMSHWDVATMYINQSPDKAWTQILNSRNSASSTRRLMSLAAQDESGLATEQLRESFLEHAIQSSIHTSGPNTGMIDSRKLATLLESRSFREAQSELLTREQRVRWGRVLRTAQRLDLRSTRPSGEGVLGDKPGWMTNVLSRLLGGTVGRATARAGVGGSIQTVQTISNAFAQLAERGVVDPAKHLIIDAVMAKDDELFKALLDVRPNLPAPPKVQQRLNGWAAMAIYNYGNEQ